MFSMEHCVLNSFVGARKGVGVLCILVLRFNKVQPSLQPQQVLKPVGVASSGETPGLRTDLRWEGCSPLCPPPAQGEQSSASKCCVSPNVSDSSGPGPKAVRYLDHVGHPSHSDLSWALLGLCPGGT